MRGAAVLFLALFSVLARAQFPSFSCIANRTSEAQCRLAREDAYYCSWSGAYPQWVLPNQTYTSGVCFRDPTLPVSSDAPLKGAVSPPPLLALLKADPSAAKFYAWMEREKLASLLDQVRAPLTLFALSDGGMDILSELMNRTGVVEDAAIRARLLLHHFVPALVPEPALINGSYLGTLAGPRFFLRPAVAAPRAGIVSGAAALYINGAPVGRPSSRASNGVLFVLDEPPVTPMMVVAASSEPAWSDPRTDEICADLLRAVQQSCASQMCGTCHTSICAASAAVGCQFKTAAFNQTFRDATTGTYAVCRVACPEPKAALDLLVSTGVVNGSFMDRVRAAPSVFPFSGRTESDMALDAALGRTTRAAGGAGGFNVADFGQYSASGSLIRARPLSLQDLPPCDPGCQDVPPPSPQNFTCDDQALWGKCGTIWMNEGQWCQRTCYGCFTGCRSLPLGAACGAAALNGSQDVPCGPGLRCDPNSNTCVPDAPSASLGAVGLAADQTAAAGAPVPVPKGAEAGGAAAPGEASQASPEATPEQERLAAEWIRNATGGGLGGQAPARAS